MLKIEHKEYSVCDLCGKVCTVYNGTVKSTAKYKILLPAQERRRLTGAERIARFLYLDHDHHGYGTWKEYDLCVECASKIRDICRSKEDEADGVPIR